MRPYRGRRLDNGEWAKGSGVSSAIFAAFKAKDRMRLYVPPTANSEPGKKYGWVEVDPATVGQSTGIQDINGVEIYEGSTCRFGHKKHNRDAGKVVYCLDFCAFGCWQTNIKKPRFHLCHEDFEVIHDNPELIE